MRRVVIALILLSVCACANSQPTNAPAAVLEWGSPTTGDWRSAAASIGARLAAQLRDRDGVVLSTGPREAADYFTDLLLQDLFQQGLAVAERPTADAESLATLGCRSAQFGETRRDVSSFDLPGNGIALVCTVTWHGRYIAAADYLVTKVGPQPSSQGGVMIRVTR